MKKEIPKVPKEKRKGTYLFEATRLEKKVVKENKKNKKPRIFGKNAHDKK